MDSDPKIAEMSRRRGPHPDLSDHDEDAAKQPRKKEDIHINEGLAPDPTRRPTGLEK